MFTYQEQAAHCRQLADLLETDKVKAHYNHGVWFGTRRSDYFAVDGVENPDRVRHGEFECATVACALGWAAVARIGGMRVADGVIQGHLYPALSEYECSSESADEVFGPCAYETIFTSCRSQRGKTTEEDRQISVELLRNHAAVLETNPALLEEMA